jgi:preprotein translocase subunit SecG
LAGWAKTCKQINTLTARVAAFFLKMEAMFVMIYRPAGDGFAGGVECTSGRFALGSRGVANFFTKHVAPTALP